MGKATAASHIEQIGETAGLIWHALDGQEAISITKLAKQIEAPRDTFMQAIGWLARENKICIEQTKRARTISLR